MEEVEFRCGLEHGEPCAGGAGGELGVVPGAERIRKRVICFLAIVFHFPTDLPRPALRHQYDNSRITEVG